MIEEVGGDLFQWFRSFYYVVTCGSFTEAARLLHRNQSAVTYQIKSLENELGVQLLRRLKNRIEVTDEGEILFKWILRTFDAISGMRQELGWRDKRGICRISASRPTFVSDPFMQSLVSFHAAWPNIHVYLNNSNPHQIYQDIQKGTIDFAVYGNARSELDLDFKPLFSSPCLLAVGKKETARLDARPTIAQLEKLSYIPLDIDRSGLPLYRTFLPREIAHLFGKRSWLSGISFQVILRYVAIDGGCTVLDMWSLKALNEYARDLKFYRLDHLVPPVEYGILSREGFSPGPAIAYFRNMLETSLSGICLEKEAEEMCEGAGGAD